MSVLTVQGNPHADIQKKEVKLQAGGRPPEFTDDAALKLVVQDAARAEQFLDQKQWALDWRQTDVLYQSPRTLQVWENSTVTRANVSRFTVAKHVNALVTPVMEGIFYDTPPFVLRPRPNTTQNTTRAWSALLSALLDMMDFKYECEMGIHSQTNKGTGLWKYGYYTERKMEKRFIRKKAPARVSLPFGQEKQVHTAESDEFDIKEVLVERWVPFFEFRPLGELLIDPGWRHPNKPSRAKYVVDRKYMSAADLNELRGVDGYDIPSIAELEALCFPPTEATVLPSSIEQQKSQNSSIHSAESRAAETTADPLEKPWKVDERWDKNRVITVVQDKVIIRNQLHEFGAPPFLGANWWNIENAGYGLGVGRLVGSDQRVEQGATNAALDILSMKVNPSYLRARTSNAETQQIRSRLSGVITVDLGPGQRSVHDAFGVMETPDVPADVWRAIADSRQSGESTTGADEAMVQGSLPARGGSSIGRTATGAGKLAAASAGRIQGPVGRFVDNVFIPFLEALDKMVREHMPLSQIREIIAGETDDLEVDFDNFLNARMRYEVLAGAHLAAKQAMAQSLPYMIQILENPHMLQSLNATGWTVDIKEVFAMVQEVSSWKNSRTLVRLMTKEESAMYQQQTNPLQQKLAGDIQKMQAQGAIDAQQIDQKNEAKLAIKLTEDALDRGTSYAERQVASRAVAPFELGSGPGGAEGQYTTTGA